MRIRDWSSTCALPILARKIYALASAIADHDEMSEPMTGQDDPQQPSAQEGQETAHEPVSSRRQLLMGGAIAASAIVSIRPALANTAASVLNCTDRKSTRLNSSH